MATQCDYCNEVNIIETHYKKTSLCYKLQNISYTCDICCYNTKNFGKICSHRKKCDTTKRDTAKDNTPKNKSVVQDNTEDFSMIKSLWKKIEILEDENLALKYKIKATRKKKRQMLEMNSSLLTTNGILSYILKQNCNIDMFDYLSSIGAVKTKTNTLENYIPSFMGKKSPEKKGEKRIIYRKINVKQIREPDETDIEDNDTGKRVEKNTEKIIPDLNASGLTPKSKQKPLRNVGNKDEGKGAKRDENKENIDENEHKENHDKLLFQLYNTENINLVKDIFSSRLQFCSSIHDYKNKLCADIEFVKNPRGNPSFVGKKKGNEKMVDIFLSDFDRRLLLSKNFAKTEVDLDYIEILSKQLKFNAENIRIISTFNIPMFTFNLKSEELMLFPVEDILHRFLTRNYVYVHMATKSDKADPFRFYYLEHIEEKKIIKRKNVSNKTISEQATQTKEQSLIANPKPSFIYKWRLDCRTISIVDILSEDILIFCIDKFREVYHQIFHDNTYRNNYKSFCNIFMFELNQLFENMLKIYNKKRCCNMVRDIVMSKGNYVPSDDDKFHISTDDSTVKKDIEDTKKTEDEDRYKLVEKMFDGIGEKDIHSFLKN